MYLRASERNDHDGLGRIDGARGLAGGVASTL